MSRTTSAWRAVPLSAIADVSFSSVDKKHHSTEEEVRLCNYVDVLRNSVLDDGHPFTSGTATGSEMARFSLRQGDIVLTKDSETAADIARVARVVGRMTKVVLGYHLALVRIASDAVDPDYLYWALQHTECRRHFVNSAVGAVRAGLSVGAMLAVPVLLPPRDVQKRVARVLSAYECLEMRIAALIASRRAFQRALLRELLTGRRRFPEFAGSQPWSSASLGDLASSVTRRNANGADERVLTCSGEYGLVDQRQFFSKLVAGESREGYFLLKRGEFAYNRSAMKGYPYGATKRLDQYESGVLSTLNICFALTNDSCTSDFLLHLFESGLLNQQLGRIARVGSRAHGLLNVNKSDFFEIEVQLPSVAEQGRITAVLNALDREIALLDALRRAYEALRRALMHRLLSGDLPLPAPTAAPELAHA